MVAECVGRVGLEIASLAFGVCLSPSTRLMMVEFAALIAKLARVAELVDAADLKSAGHCGRAGSIPAPGTSD